MLRSKEMCDGHTRIACALVLAACVTATTAVCSSSGKGVDAPTTTTLAVETKGFATETPDGQVSLSLDGVLPPHWPANFPVASAHRSRRLGLARRYHQDCARRCVLVDRPAADVYRFYASNSAYSVDRSTSVGNGSFFVGNIGFSGAVLGQRDRNEQERHDIRRHRAAHGPNVVVDESVSARNLSPYVAPSTVTSTRTFVGLAAPAEVGRGIGAKP